MIRNVGIQDSEVLVDIYNYYIENSIITFEEELITSETMRERITDTIADLPWIVYEDQDQVLGYAYASKWKGRCAYRYAVESTVYLDPKAVAKGIGTSLCSELLKRLKDMSFHTVIAGIALPNPASIALHEKLGFNKVACFKEVGYKFNKWIDVEYWQKVFD